MKKRIWIIILASVVAISLIITAVVALTSGETKKSWQEQYDLGVRYLNNGNYEEAIIAFTAAIEIDPRNPDSYIGRADAYTKLGDIASARTDYETVLTIDDSFVDAWLGLAETYVSEGNIEKALEVLQDAAAKTGDSRFKAKIEELEPLTSNIRWTFENGTLTISGEGPMEDYKIYYLNDDLEEKSTAPWNSYRSDIERIVVETGVTTISRNAFSDCNNLTSVTIPDSVTMIGDDAFYGCINLTGVTIPDSVTEIGTWAFCGCENLESIELPDSVTTIGDGAFIDCYNLTSVEIPNSVTTIGSEAFINCWDLTSIDIPNSVTMIGEAAFGGCSNLQSINVETGNQDYISIDGVLFSRDMTLLHAYLAKKEETSYKIPDGVTKIGSHAFFRCDNLTSIEIPNSVTMIGDYAFSGTSLTSVEIPDGVTTIGDNAFWNCQSFTSIEIPNSVTMIGEGAFNDCYSLQSINVEAGNRDYISVDGVLFSRDMTLLHTYPANKVQVLRYPTV